MTTNKELKSYIYSLAYKYKVYLVSIMLVSICAGIFDIFAKYQIKEIIDAIAGDPEADIAMLLLLFVIYTIMLHGVFFIRRLFDIKYNPSILAEIVESAYIKTMRHSLHWFDSHLSGEIANKITDFQDSIINLITIISRCLCNLVIIVIGIVFLFSINPLVAGLMVIYIIIYVPIISILLKKPLEITEEYVKAKQECVGIINDSISNVVGIKIIGNVWAELKLKLLPSIAKWKKWDKKTRQYDAYYVDLTDTILITIMSAAQILLLAYLYKSGQITAGDFAFISMIALSIYDQVDILLENILFSINPKIATVRTSYRFINSTTDMQDIQGAKILSRIKGEIKYENVTFNYEDNKQPVFEHLNLHIKPGERVGIVGTSGAGKTTLIKCLLRYFNLKKGHIFVDGHSIHSVTEESLRANISVIPQDITMFHRSILENLRIAKYDATQEEIEEACIKARIHEDIKKMPQGYHTIVGERGVKVSGGQRQRIAIARAILKNTPILILDEATSALDTPTESLIQESINEMLETINATTIVIAHRLSTLLHMDRILVFEKGKIIEDGPHAKLILMNGVYKSLWDAQAGGFILE